MLSGAGALSDDAPSSHVHSLVTREVAIETINPLTGHPNRSVIGDGNFGGKALSGNGRALKGVKLQTNLRFAETDYPIRSDDDGDVASRHGP